MPQPPNSPYVSFPPVVDLSADPQVLSMQIAIGLFLALCAVFLLISAKQVSRDTERASRTHRGSLTGPLPAGAVRIAGAGCLALAALWLFYWSVRFPSVDAPEGASRLWGRRV